ncbi:LOW QUALITY PROTEIN: uncharacterized protein WCC33_016775 [Rhinophrynus dorsalis]
MSPRRSDVRSTSGWTKASRTRRKPSLLESSVKAISNSSLFFFKRANLKDYLSSANLPQIPSNLLQELEQPISKLKVNQPLSLPSPSSAAKKSYCFKSHSHLTSLSLLLLLAAGDISPNPGPRSILSCKPTPTQTCNIHNLITVPSPNLLPPFCFGHWNTRSVCNKLTAVHDLFIYHSLNHLAISETWLTSSDTASTAALSHGGLHFTHTPSPGNSKGVGVGILLSPNHTFQIIPTVRSLSFPTFETHTIRLFSPFIYRPPGPTVQFLDHFASWLPHFMSSDVPNLILGDFNIPVEQPPLFNNLLWPITMDLHSHTQ